MLPYLIFFYLTLQENFRKAAQVMYECGSRLGNELCNLEGLRKQVTYTYIIFFFKIKLRLDIRLKVKVKNLQT